MDTQKHKLAALWQPRPDKKVQCGLCHFRCTIPDGKFGHCRVRKNIDGKLYALTFDKICASNDDPIEKKPLFHFQPGSKSFSIATEGCNLNCTFCQNWQISQAAVEKGTISGHNFSPDQIVQMAKQTKCKSIAYTYTEPTIFFELCEETGKIAKQQGLKNIFVSNGYMTKQAIDLATDWLDAINIDLKAFTEDYYTRLCNAHLAPVLEMIEYIAKNTDIWTEITTLIVPGQNDDPEQLKKLADFIVTAAGPDTPWHISRFHPQYKCLDSPPTPMETLEIAHDIGKNAGLNYIYIGNVPGSSWQTTYCPNCKIALIERHGYSNFRNNLIDSKCPECKTPIPGVELS